MQSYDKINPLEDLKFHRTLFWAQVHGIPLRYMNIKAAKKTCEVLGQVIPSNGDAGTEGGSFIRVWFL